MIGRGASDVGDDEADAPGDDIDDESEIGIVIGIVVDDNDDDDIWDRIKCIGVDDNDNDDIDNKLWKTGIEPVSMPPGIHTNTITKWTIIYINIQKLM